jgi:hypothetical protein
MRRLDRPGRTHIVALLIGVPTLISAVGVAAIEAWEFVRPDSALFAAPPPVSLAETIASGDVLATYMLIRAGHDPNRPIVVQHPVFTDGRPVMMPPLVWAVATESNQIVSLLLNAGARLDETLGRRTVCLAAELGNDEIARLLESYGKAAGPLPCPQGDTTRTSIVSWLTEAR